MINMRSLQFLQVYPKDNNMLYENSINGSNQQSLNGYLQLKNIITQFIPINENNKLHPQVTNNNHSLYRQKYSKPQNMKQKTIIGNKFCQKNNQSSTLFQMMQLHQIEDIIKDIQSVEKKKKKFERIEGHKRIRIKSRIDDEKRIKNYQFSLRKHKDEFMLMNRSLKSYQQSMKSYELNIKRNELGLKRSNRKIRHKINKSIQQKIKNNNQFEYKLNKHESQSKSIDDGRLKEYRKKKRGIDEYKQENNDQQDNKLDQILQHYLDSKPMINLKHKSRNKTPINGMFNSKKPSRVARALFNRKTSLSDNNSAFSEVIIERQELITVILTQWNNLPLIPLRKYPQIFDTLSTYPIVTVIGSNLGRGYSIFNDESKYVGVNEGLLMTQEQFVERWKQQSELDDPKLLEYDLKWYLCLIQFLCNCKKQQIPMNKPQKYLQILQLFRQCITDSKAKQGNRLKYLKGRIKHFQYQNVVLIIKGLPQYAKQQMNEQKQLKQIRQSNLWVLTKGIIKNDTIDVKGKNITINNQQNKSGLNIITTDGQAIVTLNGKNLQSSSDFIWGKVYLY